MNATLKIGLCAFGLTVAALADAEELGRLFFTPQQRAQLDQAFAGEAKPDSGGRRTLSVTGIVQRQGGKRTIWINGVPQLDGKSDDRSPESAAITIPGQKKKIRVKVGQKVLVNPAASDK